MPQFQRMIARGPNLARYSEYLQYVESGEADGPMSYDEWIGRNPENGL